MNYIYEKYKDKHTITNNEISDITCTINIIGCDSTKEINTFVIKSNSTKELIFKYDGVYEIILNSSSEQISFTIKYYQNLLDNIINSINIFICNCNNCNNIEDCSNESKRELLDLFTDIYSYKIIFNDELNMILNSIESNFNCSIKEIITDITLCKNITNKCCSSELLKLIILIIYLAIYFSELFFNIDSEEKQYTKDKFKIEKFKVCFKKLGIIVSEVQDFSLEFLQQNNIPKHLSKIKYQVDINTLVGIPKSLFLLNFENSTNGGIPNYIQFYNIDYDKINIKFSNGDIVENNVEYDLSSFNSTYYPEVIRGSNIDVTHPNCVIYIECLSDDFTLNYGIRNSVSELYNTTGKIFINLV